MKTISFVSSGVVSRGFRILSLLCACLGAQAAQSAESNGIAFNGTLPGAFSVSPTGAATYSIPIEVPPGIGGMTPQLSLNYNSQSGNGLLGVGWSLGGLSAITRCPATLAQDGFIDGVDFDANDRFCLDGQRLIELSTSTGCPGGAEYRTEIDSYARICSYGTAGVGPSWFKVFTKAGLVMEYGNTSDSKIEAQGKASVMMWAVNRVEDTVGNNYKVTYAEQPDHLYSVPFRIDYTENENENAGRAASHTVLFDYETRPDVEMGYVGGSLLSNLKRLQYIRTYTGQSLVGEYRLTYSQGSATARSLLNTLERCDANGDCSDITASVYGDAVNKFSQVSNQSVGAWSDRMENLVMDVNADGRADLVRVWTNGSTTYALPFFSTGSGLSGGSNSAVGGYCNDANCNFVNLALDVNGDGKTDLVRRWSSTATNRSYTYTYLSTGTKFGNAIVSDVGGACIADECNIQEMGMEMDGDGRSDLVRIWKNGTNAYALAFRSNGSGFVQVSNQSIGAWADNTGRIKNLKMDVDGDGRSDIVRLWYDGTRMLALPYFSAGNGFQQGNNSDVGGYCNDQNCNFVDLPMDVNGDGKTDLVRRWRNGTSAHVNVYLSDGTGFIQASNQSVGAWCIAEDCEIKEIAMDVNGDGKEDLVRRWKYGATASAYAVVYRSNGKGFDQQANSDIGGWCNVSECRINEVPMDVNGDGKTDLVRLWKKNNGGAGEAWALVQQSSGIVPDRLASINPRDGQGMSPIQVQYSSLTDSAIYTKEANAVYPFVDLQMPMYVVKEYSTPDGNDGLLSAGYSYAGLKSNLRGRGSLGFRRITSVNHQTGVITEIYRNQNFAATNDDMDFPKVGAVDSIVTTLSGSTLSSSTTTYLVKKSPTTNVFALFPATSTQETYEPNNNALVSTVTTDNQEYDDYGNPATIIVTSVGGDQPITKITENTYTNDTVKWHLGRLSTSRVTSGSVSRTSSFEYDATTGLLTAEIVEPGDPQLMLRTEYGYDGYGNKNSVTVSDSGGNSYPITTATSTTDYNYDQLAVNGTYTVTSTNAKLHTETQIIDARFGKPLMLTGPNGLTTTWEYDGFGRVKTETRADGTQTTTSYTWCNSGCAGVANAVYAVTTETSGAPDVIVYYDSLGREVRSKTVDLEGDPVYKDTTYNALGQVASVSRPHAGTTPDTTDYIYDVLGRVKKETAADGGVTETTYNGLTTTVRRYRGSDYDQTVKRETDVEGNLIKATDEGDNVTEYQYDPFGNLTKVIDPALNETVMTYDLRGRKIAMDDPDMGHWEYEYDALGQLRWQQDAKGQVVEMEYDVLGRMTSRVEPEGTSTWTYDQPGSKGIGKLWQVSGPNGYSETATYDNYGRPVQTLQTLNGSNFTTSSSYDGEGRLDVLTYPSGFQLKHGYSDSGYLEKVSNANATTEVYWTAQEMSPDGQIAMELLGNGVTTTRIFDPASGRMTSLASGLNAGSEVQNLYYDYDALGNLKERLDVNLGGLSEKFTYDDYNRLTRAEIVGVGPKIWAYDDLGNITEKDGYADYAYGTAGSKPHAVTAARGSTYAYDANGNMENGGGRTLTWNSANLPTRIVKGSATAEFSYGPDRARYKQVSVNGGTTTTTLYVGKLYEQVSANGVVTHKNYITAGGRVVAVRETVNTVVTMKYLHQDHLGSTDVITGANGQVLERQSYDAFGTRRVSTDWRDPIAWISSLYSTRGYTGHEMLDGVGLIHMNGRVYDPALGRFISADPHVQAPGNSQSLNRFGYVFNNPLSMTDPSGFFGGWLGEKLRDFDDDVLDDFIGIDAENENLQPIVQIGATLACGGDITCGAWASAGISAGFTLTNGGNLWDAAKAGAISYSTVYAFDWAGGVPAGSELGVEHFARHALVGCASSAASGGSCGRGAASAMAGLAGTPYGFVGAVVAGGTASVIGGGKFANGAATAAFGYLYNNCQHSGICTLFGDGGYDQNNVMGGFDEYGDSLVYHPEYYDPDSASAILVAGASLAVPEMALARAGGALRVTGGFLGPRGPVFGTSYYRGHRNSGFLNHGPVRIGWSYNQKTDRVNFSLRVKEWHSDKYFNPISMKAPER